VNPTAIPNKNKFYQFSRTPNQMNSETKLCGHVCCPSSELEVCCGCADVRPMSDGYAIYVDGVGHTTTASRNEHYCPVCNTKNYDKWLLRVKLETEKKKQDDVAKQIRTQQKTIEAELDRARAAESSRSFGIINYSNGDVYNGVIVNGERHGDGSMVYADDNDDNAISFVGHWANGLHHGFGRKDWLDNIYYEGHWCANMMHGRGKWHLNDVDIIEGEFENDEICS